MPQLPRPFHHRVRRVILLSTAVGVASDGDLDWRRRFLFFRRCSRAISAAIPARATRHPPDQQQATELQLRASRHARSPKR